MKDKQYPEIVSAIVLTVVAVLLVNPFHLWMPNMAHMAILAAVVVAFGVFAVFVLRERVGDEREDVHRMFAGRVAYLSGALVLIVAIVVESIAGSLDPWLVVALLAMVIGKVGAHIYSARYR
ncbi:hypothetical protein COU18_01060 [Candidatus Kaiserbacteria bacterium CG10_big_fil_rev_8_21_14_0_10_51_14]|uniref:DUF2178 domain-containing protein n=1 Tax=Candidatus Kaiserbacteria bacterium CG10_big_fil_rev_8_21_14_0_10_51_14 TaxID=1974610 RepID=A0A2H0UCA0_9BACT|nr:MAG: hypothetical protein COU18_01060 [Candidatus Kaiserbacteria bacterium CG10_big_fil_rev_8_21_14_0_10_51_14]